MPKTPYTRCGARVALLFLIPLLAAGCAPTVGGEAQTPAPEPEGLELAIFAGGCFWCMEAPFDELDGVYSTTSGYTAGRVVDPTYEQVSAGGTGHAEAVEVRYDPEKVSYEKLLYVFWRNIDPTTGDRQFCDRGSQYRPAIFTVGPEQAVLALESKRDLEESGRFSRPLAVEIEPASVFYPAEEYHQDFYRKSPVRYKTYRTGCGRDRRLAELWGDEAGGGH